MSTDSSNILPEGSKPEGDFERLKSAMVSLISHELRTPLTYISASLEMLEIAYESPEMQGEVKRFLNIIDQGVKQLNASIDELLTFSTLEAQTSKPQTQSPTAVNLRKLVLEVLNILKPTYSSKRQIMEVSIQDDLPPAMVDPAKLSEVLLQLLSNAIKFTPNEGHIRIMVSLQSDTYTLVISDSGPGIPEDVAAQIFDPFFQKEDHLVRENGGLGLGLTLVQRLCHSIGAELSHFSEGDANESGYSGTNFVVKVPYHAERLKTNPELSKAIEEMQRLSRSNAEKEAQVSRLKSQLLSYTEDLQVAYQSTEQAQSALDSIYQEMMQGFAAALELKDPYTRGRSRRMARIAQAVSQALDLDEQSTRYLEEACTLCDIGYIGISDEILHKNQMQTLSKEERKHIQSHPKIGAEMLRNIKVFEPIVPVIKYHHENWDGSGYPEGLKGKDIPLLSRVMRIIDAFEAMLSDRAYRQRMEPQQALEEIQRAAGSHFDPEIVKILSSLWTSGQLQALLESLETKPEGV